MRRYSRPTPALRSFAALLCGAGVLLGGVVLSGCGASAPPSGLGGEGEFLRGRQLFEQRRFPQAVEVLEVFRTEHPGSDRIDDAIFLLGRARQEMDEHLLAREEFNRLLRDYPQSEHREEAQYQLAQSWFAVARAPMLDPEPTQEALDAFQEYLELYPSGRYREEAERHVRISLDRLATKAFLNGELYLRLGHAEAAVIYLEKSLRILSDSSRAGEALLLLGRAHVRLGDTEKARLSWLQLLVYATPERLDAEPRLRSIRSRAEAGLANLPAAHPSSAGSRE